MVVPFAISVPAADQSIATCHAGGLVGASAAPASTAGSLPNLRTVWRETPSASATFRIDSPWLKSTLICSCICALFLSLAMAGTSAMAGLEARREGGREDELDHLQTGGQLPCKRVVNSECNRAITLLVIDEIGFLAFDNRNADLLFQIVSRRYEKKSTVVTTNLLFRDWSTIFPNAMCATALIERLIHHADVISIQGKSYRAREAEQDT